MLSRILVPMGGSEMAERALAYALENHPDAEITVLTVVGAPSSMLGEAVSLALEEDVEAAARERAEAVQERARKLAVEYGAEVETVVAVGHPARSIVSRAENFDAIVMGSHAGNVTSWLYVGNVAKTVFRRSPVPVTFVR